MAKIKTTGDLREFLCSMINGVSNGTVEIEKARTATKLAAQVNESFYSEIKIARTRRETGESTHELGALPINQDAQK